MESMTGLQVVVSVLGTVGAICATIFGVVALIIRFVDKRIDDAKDATNTRFDDFRQRFEDARQENKAAHDGIIKRVETVDAKLDKLLAVERRDK